MIYQTDTRLRLEARDDECYLFVLLKIFEDLTKYNFSVDEIDKMHEILVKLEYIRLDGFIGINAIQGIAQVASGISNKHAYMRRVELPHFYNYLIGCFGREENGKLLTHFVEMFKQQPTVVKWDPYSPNGSRTVREGKLLSYRYIHGEVI